MIKPRHITFFVIALLLAMVLDMMSLPTWLRILWPQWTFVVLISWVLLRPTQVHFFLAFIVGLYMDLLTRLPMGTHVLSYVVVFYFIKVWSARLKFYAGLQRFLTLLLLSAINIILQKSFILNTHDNSLVLLWLPSIIFTAFSCFIVNQYLSHHEQHHR